MEDEYKYLFPFEKIPKKSRIIIYGAGILGQEYLKQMFVTEYCKVVGFVDRSYDKYPKMCVPIYNPSAISTLEYDFVVIAIKRGNSVTEITELLKGKGVDEEKIIYVGERRNSIENLYDNNDGNKRGEGGYAFNSNEISFSFYMTGGFGDGIFHKRIIDEFIKYVPNCMIDIYHPRASLYLSPLYTGCSNINKIVDDGGGVFNENFRKYALSMHIGMSTKVDWLDEEKLEQIPFFLELIKKIKKKTELDDKEFVNNYYVQYMRDIYKGYNAYTRFSFDGILGINDKRVFINLDESYEERFKKLNLHKYISVNYGNGTSNDEKNISKQWSYNNFNNLLVKIKNKYKTLQIVQVGSSRTKRLNNIDVNVLGEDFELVKFVLKNSLIHIDIEGGLVHLATQLGTKCCVIFGPTLVKYFGYESNINIVPEKCNGCFSLYSNVYVCARGMDYPECMRSIHPDAVFKEVDKYLTQILQL